MLLTTEILLSPNFICTSQSLLRGNIRKNPPGDLLTKYRYIIQI